MVRWDSDEKEIDDANESELHGAMVIVLYSIGEFKSTGKLTVNHVNCTIKTIMLNIRRSQFFCKWNTNRRRWSSVCSNNCLTNICALLINNTGNSLQSSAMIPISFNFSLEFFNKLILVDGNRWPVFTGLVTCDKRIVKMCAIFTNGRIISNEMLTLYKDVCKWRWWSNKVYHCCSMFYFKHIRLVELHEYTHTHTIDDRQMDSVRCCYCCYCGWSSMLTMMHNVWTQIVIDTLAVGYITEWNGRMVAYYRHTSGMLYNIRMRETTMKRERHK